MRVTNISKSFTHKMAVITNWHRYGTKLRHCHPVYTSRSSLQHGIGEVVGSFIAKNQLDPSSRFDRTPTYDRRTEVDSF